MSTQAVLYDAQGPRGRRRTRIATAISLLLLLGLGYLVLRRLADQGELTMEKWGPLVDPSNESFEAVWGLLGQGVLTTIQAALLAMTLSILLGTLIAVGRLSLGRAGRIPLIGLVELLRGLPVVVLVFFGVRVLPDVGVDLRDLPGGQELWGLVIALTAYNMVIFAEVVRAGVASLPRGQREAALATGLTNGQAMRLVLLPQALRTVVPPLGSVIIAMFKNSAVVGAFGVGLDLWSNAQTLISARGYAALPVFTGVAIGYLCITLPAAALLQVFERRVAIAR